MDIFVPKFIKYQLYLLQLENYELGRYWKLLKQKGFWPKKNQLQRKELVWTAKTHALMVMAWALHALLIIIAGLAVLSLRPGLDNLFSVLILAVLVFLPFYFVFFSAALLVIRPLDAYVKNKLVFRAREKIRKLSEGAKGGSGGNGSKGLVVVGVAGSYGKTTMKEVLKQVVSCKLKVVSTPESVNTPVGIARFVLNRVTPDTRILILELGEHYRGDVKELCQIAPPDVSVITGINEAHLERMGSLDNIIATIFEAVEFAKEDSLIILNADDKNVDENYQKFVKQGQKVKEFQISNFKFEKFNQEKLCWEAEAEGLGKIEINLLGEYALSDAAAAIIAAKHLGLSDQEIKMGFLNVKPVEHRLQPIPSAGGVLVIDDSYNGNPEGAKEAIAVLSRFTNRRKIYITPGLVEMGGAAPEIHRQLGKQLAGVADVVILVKDSVTQWIEEGIRNAVIARSASDEAILSENRLPRPSAALGARNDKPIVIWFNTAQEAHEGLKNIIKPGDVVLFQNDWGDQYI